MNHFRSHFATDILAMLQYRSALGYNNYAYETILFQFDHYCMTNYPEEIQLTQELVLSWLAQEKTNINMKATAIRTFGKYRKAIEKSTYILYKKYGGKQAKSQPYLFTDEEMTRLFFAIDHIKPTKAEPFLHEVLPVLLRLIYTCGLRPGEGRNLRLEHIDFRTGEVFIANAKGKKDRVVVMSKDMLQLCKIYNKRREIFAPSTPWFFPSWTEEPFSHQQLNQFFKQCFRTSCECKSAKELPAVRVYDLRHRFASKNIHRWLDSQENVPSKLPYLRAYMGHNSLSETAYYIHLLPENLIKSSGVDWSAFASIIPEVSLWEEL